MDTQLFELKTSLKQLNQNLVARIDSICEGIGKMDGAERLTFWLEDLSLMTETMLILIQNETIDFEIVVFNEKIEDLLNKIAEKDFLFVGDLLQYEIKPLLLYLDGCITND
jgi:hypothetical protein